MNNRVMWNRTRFLANAVIPTRTARRVTVLLALTWWGSVLFVFALGLTEGVPEGVGSNLPWAVWLASELNTATGTAGTFAGFSIPFVVLIFSRANPVKRVYESILTTYIITAPMMVTDTTTYAIEHVHEYSGDIPSGYVQSEFLSGFTDPLNLMAVVLMWILPFAVAWWALERYRPGYLTLGPNLETKTDGGVDR